MTEPPFDFGIVIPVLGWSDFLPFCLSSCIAQEGGHTVHIVVVDKSDSKKVAELCVKIEALSVRPGAIKISHFVADDSGPADAIGQAMNRLDANFLTWLGADDYLLPGALAAVFSIAQENTGAEWFTGLSKIVDSQGISYTPKFRGQSAGFPTGFPRKGMAMGLSASANNLPFVQQEGTFWTANVWKKAGAKLDTRLGYAFDFELWTRLAEHSELLQINSPLGVFRRREGQLSSNREAYFREVSLVRTELAKKMSTMRFPFVESGRLAIYSEGEGWSVKTLFFVFWSPSKSPHSFGLFDIRARLLATGASWYRTNPIIRFVASVARRAKLLK